MSIGQGDSDKIFTLCTTRAEVGMIADLRIVVLYRYDQHPEPTQCTSSRPRHHIIHFFDLTLGDGKYVFPVAPGNPGDHLIVCVYLRDLYSTFKPKRKS